MSVNNLDKATLSVMVEAKRVAREMGISVSKAFKNLTGSAGHQALSVKKSSSGAASSSEGFVDAVSALQETGLTLAKAIREAAKSHPDSHAAFLGQIGGITFAAASKKLTGGRQAAAGTFEAAVLDFQKKDGLSRAAAIKAVARKHPDLHAAYLNRIKA